VFGVKSQSTYGQSIYYSSETYLFSFVIPNQKPPRTHCAAYFFSTSSEMGATESYPFAPLPVSFFLRVACEFLAPSARGTMALLSIVYWNMALLGAA
jgi:hypothetical protein